MKRIASILVLFAALTPFAAPSARADIAQLQKDFQQPPDNARPMVRWWWYGPSATKPEIEREMNVMKQGGFGGFELQTTYPLSVDNPQLDIRNYNFLSPEHLDAIGFAAAKAKELGLRMDLTLGSGWPYGGPRFTAAEGAGRLVQSQPMNVNPGDKTVAFPQLREGQSVAAALLGPVTNASAGQSPYVALELSDGAAKLPLDLSGATQVIFYLNGQTGMKVKRPALGAEGYVIDHYSPAVISKFINDMATPALKACGPNVPYSIFCDSLEVAGEDWTPTFLAQFKKLRGYDLTPWLPAIFDNNFPRALEIRHDWGQTITDIFNSDFTATFEKFAKDNGTLFRIQAYGTPPANLATYAFADLDEGEQGQMFDWQSFHPVRLASSASHLLGRPVASSEAMTWLHSPVFMAGPLDMKAAADLHFLQGVNQFILHGWPYTPPKADYPGWAFYAAAVFDEKNPWWIAMPDVTKYIQRVSTMMREGTSANDVALYLPDQDAWASFRSGSVQMSDIVARALGGSVMRQILQSGYNLDFFDDDMLAMHGKADGGALAFGDVKYKIVVLPQTDRMPPTTLAMLEQFVNGGGTLIAIGHPPISAPGFMASEADQKAVADSVKRLFTDVGAKGKIVATAEELSPALIAGLRPDVAFAAALPDVGFVHRHTSDADIYFLANTSNQQHESMAVFHATGKNAEWWDPLTGLVTPANIEQKYTDGTAVKVSLPAYGSQLLVFTTRALPTPTIATTPAPPALDLSGGWSVTFKNANPAAADPAAVQMDTLRLWTADENKQYFSGTATYTKKMDVSADLLKPGLAQYVDFGAGSAADAPVGRGGNGMRANYNPPVHEAAVVYINGQRAGAVWCPPFRVDVTGLLKPGSNDIRIEVANLAANDMAGKPPMDFSESRQAFQNRFQMQDMNLIRSMPSGIEGPVKLVVEIKGG